MKTENNSILNPYIALCSSNKCRKKIFLRINIFFGHFPNISCSIILYIIHSWILDNKNASYIFNDTTNKNLNINISYLSKSNILSKIRLYIAH